MEDWSLLILKLWYSSHGGGRTHVTEVEELKSRRWKKEGNIERANEDKFNVFGRLPVYYHSKDLMLEVFLELKLAETTVLGCYEAARVSFS